MGPRRKILAEPAPARGTRGRCSPTLLIWRQSGSCLLPFHTRRITATCVLCLSSRALSPSTDLTAMPMGNEYAPPHHSTAAVIAGIRGSLSVLVSSRAFVPTAIRHIAGHGRASSGCSSALLGTREAHACATSSPGAGTRPRSTTRFHSPRTSAALSCLCTRCSHAASGSCRVEEVAAQAQEADDHSSSPPSCHSASLPPPSAVDIRSWTGPERSPAQLCPSHVPTTNARTPVRLVCKPMDALVMVPSRSTRAV